MLTQEANYFVFKTHLVFSGNFDYKIHNPNGKCTVYVAQNGKKLDVTPFKEPAKWEFRTDLPPHTTCCILNYLGGDPACYTDGNIDKKYVKSLLITEPYNTEFLEELAIELYKKSNIKNELKEQYALFKKYYLTKIFE